MLLLLLTSNDAELPLNEMALHWLLVYDTEVASWVQELSV
jgi:hypothetical protein